MSSVESVSSYFQSPTQSDTSAAYSFTSSSPTKSLNNPISDASTTTTTETSTVKRGGKYIFTHTLVETSDRY